MALYLYYLSGIFKINTMPITHFAMQSSHKCSPFSPPPTQNFFATNMISVDDEELVDLQPLSEDLLDDLQDTRADSQDEHIRNAKAYFTRSELPEGLVELFTAFQDSRMTPRLQYSEQDDGDGREFGWQITFPVSPNGIRTFNADICRTRPTVL